MEAARARNRAQARAVSRTFGWCVLATGALCMAAFGTPWSWNPLPWLLPTAYAVPWLVLLTLLAQTVTGILFPHRSELLGARREAALTSTEAVTGAARIGVAASAQITHAYAVPLGYLAVGVVRAFAYAFLLRDVYRRRESGGASRDTS